MRRVTKAITKPLTGFGLPVRPYEDAGFALLELLSGENGKPKAPGLNH